MKIQSATFFGSAVDFASCPITAHPEFSFIGRSNVGKSSIINMLTNRKELAKVSSTPGKTKLINFFTINQTWILVDLPGYGYAKAGRRERTRFESLITSYLRERENLVGSFVLIDGMLPPQNIDLEFLTWMVGNNRPFVLVFTKADRLSDTAAMRNIAAFLERMKDISEEAPQAILTSSKEGTGKSEILQLIGAALEEMNSSEHA